MSFREVKSMLRMLNIDMDDIYASKLFKVPVLCCTTRVPAAVTGRESLAPSLPSPAQRTDKLLTPKATHRHQWLGPIRSAWWSGVRWSEVSQPLFCVSPRCDVSPPWRAAPLGISKGPFPPGETEARSPALLHPAMEGQRALGGGTEGTCQ